MNEHDDEISTGGRVDPDAIADTVDKGYIDKTERWFLTGRRARRAYRFGHNTHNPNRSRCQRKTAKQRAFGPTGDAMVRKQKRRMKRWLAAESVWTSENAA